MVIVKGIEEGRRDLSREALAGVTLHDIDKNEVCSFLQKRGWMVSKTQQFI